MGSFGQKTFLPEDGVARFQASRRARGILTVVHTVVVTPRVRGHQAEKFIPKFQAFRFVETEPTSVLSRNILKNRALTPGPFPRKGEGDLKQQFRPVLSPSPPFQGWKGGTDASTAAMVADVTDRLSSSRN